MLATRFGRRRGDGASDDPRSQALAAWTGTWTEYRRRHQSPRTLARIKRGRCGPAPQGRGGSADDAQAPAVRSSAHRALSRAKAAVRGASSAGRLHARTSDACPERKAGASSRTQHKRCAPVNRGAWRTKVATTCGGEARSPHAAGARREQVERVLSPVSKRCGCVPSECCAVRKDGRRTGSAAVTPRCRCATQPSRSSSRGVGEPIRSQQDSER